MAHFNNGRGKYHGLSKHSPIYIIWLGIKHRCENPKRTGYFRYGGRGIKLSQRWQFFPNFHDDMIPSWKDNLTIERIDNNGNYCPENCRWATMAEQGCNRRTNRFLDCFGLHLTIKQWAKKIGVSYQAIDGRLHRGWSLQRTLSIGRTRFNRNDPRFIGAQ